jgi:hypothetical protein
LRTIELIKAEVDDGQATLERLERDTADQRLLAELSADEARAVLTQMAEAVRVETSRGTRLQVVVGVVFFVLGVVVTLILERTGVTG